MKKHNKRQNKHYGQGHGGHSSSSSSSVNCHHGNGGYSGYDGDSLSDSSSSDTHTHYYKSPTKYFYGGTQEDGHDMFDKVLKQIEKSVLKYIKQLESEGKIMLFDTKTQSMYPSSSPHETDTKKKLKKFNTEVFDPSDGFKTEIYNDINSMVFKGGKAKPKNEYNGSGGGGNIGIGGNPHRYNSNNNQQKYSSSSVTSQYFVNEDEFIPSTGSGYEDNYKSSSSSSSSTAYDDDGCRYSFPSSQSQSQPSSSHSQPYPSHDYNNDGYPIMNPYQFVFNQDKYGRHKKDLGSKCGGSYRH